MGKSSVIPIEVSSAGGGAFEWTKIVERTETHQYTSASTSWYTILNSMKSSVLMYDILMIEISFSALNNKIVYLAVPDDRGNPPSCSGPTGKITVIAMPSQFSAPGVPTNWVVGSVEIDDPTGAVAQLVSTERYEITVTQTIYGGKFVFTGGGRSQSSINSLTNIKPFILCILLIGRGAEHEGECNWDWRSPWRDVKNWSLNPNKIRKYRRNLHVKQCGDSAETIGYGNNGTTRQFKYGFRLLLHEYNKYHSMEDCSNRLQCDSRIPRGITVHRNSIYNIRCVLCKRVINHCEGVASHG